MYNNVQEYIFDKDIITNNIIMKKKVYYQYDNVLLWRDIRVQTTIM